MSNQWAERFIGSQRCPLAEEPLLKAQGRPLWERVPELRGSNQEDPLSCLAMAAFYHWQHGEKPLTWWPPRLGRLAWLQVVQKDPWAQTVWCFKGQNRFLDLGLESQCRFLYYYFLAEICIVRACWDISYSVMRVYAWHHGTKFMWSTPCKIGMIDVERGEGVQPSTHTVLLVNSAVFSVLASCGEGKQTF